MNREDIRVIIVYKNFLATTQGISHIGLGVSAVNSAKVLHSKGIQAEILPIKMETDLRTFLSKQGSADKPVTHVIVSAPWIRTAFYQWLCATYPKIQFAMNCHSNVGFLQADTNGIKLIREGLALASAVHNFSVCGNSKRFCRFIEHAYGSPCSYLPNMYYLDGTTNVSRPIWRQCGGTLRIGAFGATRSQKNFITCVAAAIEISRDLKAQTEVWINTERNDGPESRRILAAAQMLVEGLPNVVIKKAGWQSWPNFRKVVGNMHLLLQMSYTESFNMVTADGVAEGTPSVVSNVITWAPSSWQAEADDVFDIARAGIRLLNDHMAAKNGYNALRIHNKESLQHWYNFLYLKHKQIKSISVDAEDMLLY